MKTSIIIISNKINYKEKRVNKKIPTVATKKLFLLILTNKSLVVFLFE